MKTMGTMLKNRMIMMLGRILKKVLPPSSTPSPPLSVRTTAAPADIYIPSVPCITNLINEFQNIFSLI